MSAFALTPLVSMLFSGATFTEHDELVDGAGSIGCAVWSSTQLLDQLELRLGLTRSRSSNGARLQQWSRRLADYEIANPGRFYARSYALDPVGTAKSLLEWRDELVMAGWNGEAVPDGRERLATFTALDTGLDLPPGLGDRLRRVEEELRATPCIHFDELRLTESRSLWPSRWRSIFMRLEERGTKIEKIDPHFEGAADDSDLAYLRGLLRGEPRGARALKGDGSILFLRADTSWELGEAAAALLRSWGTASTVIVRAGEARALDRGLTAQGMASQGIQETSSYRPALQVLPLALELAFEPRDPARVMELVTLPAGPFSGMIGRELAAAIADAPGIGGRAWKMAKERIVEKLRAREDGEERIEDVLTRIAVWLEAPGHPADAAAPRDVVLGMVTRVADWLQGRLVWARKKEEESPHDMTLAAQADILGSAYGEAKALHEVLAHESRDALDLVDCRLLLQQATRGHTMQAAAEQCGRLDFTDSPAALRCSREVVLWWHCVAGTEWRPPVRPWRWHEVSALAKAGIHLPVHDERLAADALGWQNAALGARKRLVLAAPRWTRGEANDPHPFWHEICARLGASKPQIAAMTLDARELLSEVQSPSTQRSPTAVARQKLGRLRYPAARAVWHVDANLLPKAMKQSATSIEALVGCPLKWVFQYAADVRSGGLTSVPSGPLLYGKLGHRLVEELHRSGTLEGNASLSESIAAGIDRLLTEEAATLLRPGMTFELAQLRRQLTRSIGRLVDMLRDSKLRVVDVEVAVEGEWRGVALNGRIDLLLSDQAGTEVVLDLKWGGSSYRDLLVGGRATQLAVYAGARKLATKARAMPVAAYFSLGSGKTIAIKDSPFHGATAVDGPSIETTWKRIEVTATRVADALARGRVLVAGVGDDRTLVERLGVEDAEREDHLEGPSNSACKYCSYDAICGRRWEGVEAS